MGRIVWLVLCHSDDLAALWAYEGLKARGLAPLELVSAECLAFSLRLEHRVRSTETTFRITLAGGRQLRSDQVFGALNRLQAVPMPHWRWATPKDREYVQQEMAAFYLSWLYGLPGPVFNRATAQGLSGAWRGPAEWRKLAVRAGLDALDYSSLEYSNKAEPRPWHAARQRLIAIEGVVSAREVPGEIAEGCGRLAELAQTPLLGLEFEVQADGTWRFAHADCTPDLREGGVRFLDSLKDCLQNGARS